MSIEQLVHTVIDELHDNYFPSRSVLSVLSTHLLQLASSYVHRHARQYTISRLARERDEEMADYYFSNRSQGALAFNQADALNKVAIANVLLHACNETNQYGFNTLQEHLIRLIMLVEQEFGLNDRLVGFVGKYVRVFYAGTALLLPTDVTITYDDRPLMNPQPILFPQILTPKESADIPYLIGSVSDTIDHETDGHSTSFSLL